MAGSLTTAQQQNVALQAANVIFGGQAPAFIQQAIATASVNANDLLAAVQEIDSAFNTTLTAAAAAVGGSTTIYNGLAETIPAPVNGLTAVQQTIIVCLVLLKRAGGI